jgi:hypothetical protein
VTVAELQDRLSLQEFWDWQLFAAKEPFLSERVDLMGALISSVIANVNRGKGQKPLTVDDFMIIARGLEGDKMPPTPVDEDNYMKSVILRLGGRVE